MTKLQILLSLALIISTYEGKWTSLVSGYNTNNSTNGYAGKLGKGISCVRMTGGKNYKVHINGGSWLSPVTGNNANDADNGYAGIKGRVIDAIAISGGVTYRVHVLGGGWLPAVTGYNTEDSINGYAGNLGQTIDAVMIKGRKYAVYYETSSSSSSSSCGLVSSGTGIAGIDKQWNIPNMKYGCLFMAACVKGGLCTTAQITKAYNWALSEGKISSDTLLYVSGSVLAGQIAAKYGTTLHNDYYITGNNGDSSTHYWLVDSSGKEIFNSAGLGIYY